MEEISFSDKIKNIFFDPKERFSRETFAITLTVLLLFTAFTSPLIGVVAYKEPYLKPRR